MLSATLGLTLVVAQTVVAGSGPRFVATAACSTCGIENTAILNEITRLQTCPNWRVRERAAHDLRRYDWRCHPEVAEVLATALLTDAHGEVREESAQSLTKMGACVPIVHQALARAASCDRNLGTRLSARRGLRALNRRCDGQCTTCDAGTAAPVVIPGPSVTVEESPAVPNSPNKVMPPATDSSVAPPANEVKPGPSGPVLDEPRLEPATGARTRSRRLGSSLLGARLLFPRR